MFESRSEIIFMVTFPLWIISLIVGMPISEHTGLLVNILCVVVTLSLIAINMLAFTTKIFDKKTTKKPPAKRSIYAKAIDDKAEELFNRLKGDKIYDQDTT